MGHPAFPLPLCHAAAPGARGGQFCAGRRSPLFRTTRRPVPAEPDAALPPRSAPRSEHAARCECSVSETPRAAADRDAATPRKTARTTAPPGKRIRTALIEVLRPVHPHRTRHPGHFSGQRKVSVLMRTTWGGPGSASARFGRRASQNGKEHRPALPRLLLPPPLSLPPLCPPPPGAAISCALIGMEQKFIEKR